MSTARESDAWAPILDAIVYSGEGRAVLRIHGDNLVHLHVFCDRADLDRLVDIVTDARDRLASGMTPAESAATAPASGDTAVTDAADAA